MIAYKGFNKNLTCTMGHGAFQYEVGKTYKEEKAQCAHTGFHCVEEPLDVLSWYFADDSRYCVVKVSGDIHEDGNDKISCSEMTILQEITLQQLGALECKWLQKHPERKGSRNLRIEEGYAGTGKIVVVRGKHPKAAGGKGATLFLLKEEKDSREIEEIGIFEIDGEEYLPNVYYRVDGRRSRCGKRN